MAIVKNLGGNSKTIYSGSIWTGGFNELKPVLTRTVTKLLKIAEDGAKNKLTSKLKGTSSGLLFGSIHFDVPTSSGTKVRGIVYAGGPATTTKRGWDYSVNVERGWKFRNETTKPGYAFMEEGYNLAVKNANSVLDEELSKIKR